MTAQTYDEFMTGIKRKRSLASAGVKPVLKCKKYKRTPLNITKAEMWKNVQEGYIKIDYKKPFIIYDGVNQLIEPLRPSEAIFNIWWEFYKIAEKLRRYHGTIDFFHSWEQMTNFINNN